MKHHKKYSDPNISDYFYLHQGNSTLHTSVTIHVKPDHYYLTSWICLWFLFLVAISFGAYQSYKENQWLTDAQEKVSMGRSGGGQAATSVDDLEQQSTNTTVTSGGSTGSSTRRGKLVFVGGTKDSTRGTTMAMVGSGGGHRSEREAVSSGDMSRTMVGPYVCLFVCVCVIWGVYIVIEFPDFYGA
jgi:hypothetical protein